MAKINLTPISASATMWGGEEISSAALDYINSSPLLVQYLNNYQSEVDAKTALPIGLYVPVGNNNPLDSNGEETTAVGSQIQILLGNAIWAEANSDPLNFVSDLSYEVGKYANFASNQQLFNSLGNLSPNDPNFNTMAGILGGIAEGQSQAFSFQVQQQVYTNKGIDSGFIINGDGTNHAGGIIQAVLDNAWTNGGLAGLPTADANNALIQAAFSELGSYNAIVNQSFPEYYSSNPALLGGMYALSNYSGVVTNQSVLDNNIIVNYSNGSIASASLGLTNGESEQIYFSGSQVSSSTYSVSGNIVENISYVHNSDGTYSSIVTDELGNVISNEEFSGLGSEVQTFTDPSSTANINASGVSLTTNASSIDINGQDFNENIFGSDKIIAAEDGDVVNISGDNNVISGSLSGDVFTLSGSDNQLNGSGSTILVAQNSLSEDFVGSNNVVSDVDGSSGGSSFGISGQNDIVNASNDTVYGQDNDTFTVNGAGNTITNGVDSTTSINGNNDNLSYIGSGSTVGISGQNDIVTGSSITVDGEDNDSLSVWGSGNSIADGLNSTTNVFGSDNNLYYAGSGSTVNVSGQNDIITGSSITVDGEDGDSLSVWGSGNSIADGLNSTTNLFGNGNDLYYAGSGSTVNVSGQNDTITGSSITVDGEDNDSLSIWGSGDYIANGLASTTSIFGSGDDLYYAGSGSTINVAGYNDILSGSGIQINGADGDSLSVYGAGDRIADGNGSTTYINGNNDVLVYAGTGSFVGVDGEDDNIDISGDTIDFSGDAAGDIVDGSGDSGTGWSGVDYIDDGSGNGGGYGYGYYGGYGFSGSRADVTEKLSSNVAAIAQFDQSQGNGIAAMAAQNGLAQAAEMSRDTEAASGAGPNVLEGARWNVPTITWSFNDTSGSQGSQYESEIEQAFATWAAASGLNFEEVSSTASSDISINWADLNTATTGEVGYTTFKAANGVIAAGASIELESPTQDGFVSSANGDQIYSGAEATFYQTVLHEIGHALGLADNADTSSIMNYDLTSSNQTLDQTDINAIQALYGASAQTTALIQAMAGGATNAGAAVSSPVDQASMQTQLLAAAH
ncbi:matrixin family metalloprotease [Burkholderia sp. 22PA0106]|uniref:matrixin family metalloprotease n=1 Tax=Burkholderia sp. 22PA0106 TaxID=3237371 RepID=UPI0039C07527